MHFYHLHALDWVDVVSALKRRSEGDERTAAVDLAPEIQPGLFPTRPEPVKEFVESGQLGMFANGYWDTRPIKLPPEANLMAVAHYLEALDLAARGGEAARHLRRQEPASELARGRRAVPDQRGEPPARSGRPPSTWSGNIVSLVARIIEQMQHLRRSGLFARHDRDRGFYKDWFRRGGRRQASSPSATFPEGGRLLRRAAGSSPRARS